MRKTALIPLALLAFAGAAQAHPGHAAQGFTQGFAHPLGGLDHMLAAIAVGIWSAQRGERVTWLLPLVFLAALGAGGATAALGIALPAAEPLILASLLVLGLAVASAARPPLPVAVLLTVLVAVAHGAAHASESAGVATFAGLLAATALLIGLAVTLALGFRRLRADVLLRFAGAATAVVGILLATR